MARVFTVDEVADYLRVTPYTVRKWLRKGKIRGRKIGRMYRIFEAELEAALAAPNEETPSQPKRTGTADLAREHQEEIERDERNSSYREWHSLSLEEKRKRLRVGRGAFAHVPFSSDDLVRERREDSEREQRRLQESSG